MVTITCEQCGTAFDTDRETPLEFMNPRRCPSCGHEHDPAAEAADDAGSDGADPLTRLEKLNELREAGAVTADEYEEKKAALLERV